MIKWLIYLCISLSFLNTLFAQNKGLPQQHYEIIDGDEFLGIRNYVIW